MAHKHPEATSTEVAEGPLKTTLASYTGGFTETNEFTQHGKAVTSIFTFTVRERGTPR